MARKKDELLRFTLSGPGIVKTFETVGVALSWAITAAERVGKTEATFTVRDFDGTVVGSVARDKHGHTFVDRAKFVGTRAVA